MGNVGRAIQKALAIKYSKFGSVAVITQQRAASYDTGTSEATTPTEPATITVKGEFRPNDEGGREGRQDGFRAGVTDVRVNSRIFVMPTLDYRLKPFEFDPAIGDLVTIAEQDYSIRFIDPEIKDDVTTRLTLHLDQA